jgi:hypothetical protein
VSKIIENKTEDKTTVGEDFGSKGQCGHENCKQKLQGKSLRQMDSISDKIDRGVVKIDIFAFFNE